MDVVSAVSGGSIIAAMWAYSDDSFEEFDARVVSLLKGGLTGKLLGAALRRAPQAAGSCAIAAPAPHGTSPQGLPDVSQGQRHNPPSRRSGVR